MFGHSLARLGNDEGGRVELTVEINFIELTINCNQRDCKTLIVILFVSNFGSRRYKKLKSFITAKTFRRNQFSAPLLVVVAFFFEPLGHNLILWCQRSNEVFSKVHN